MNEEQAPATDTPTPEPKVMTKDEVWGLRRPAMRTGAIAALTGMAALAASSSFGGGPMLPAAPHKGSRSKREKARARISAASRKRNKAKK